MFQIERQEKILKYINERQTVRTQELSDLFEISPVTIRSDINDLARRGLIIKSHGGAMSVQKRINLEIPSGVRSMQNVEAKEEIASVAADLVNDGDVIILDSGSTTLELAKRIKSRGVTVITNDIKIGTTLADIGSVTLIMTGGTLLPSVYTLVGPETIDFFKRFRVNKLFLGCDAIDFEWGVSNRTLEETATKMAMIRAAREVIAVADSSKFNRQVFVHLCGISDIHTLITDKLEAEEREKLEQFGVRVLLPDKGRHRRADAHSPQIEQGE
jgi:DeoR/GlpR family transcriptional regulator of sugar metabolism